MPLIRDLFRRGMLPLLLLLFLAAQVPFLEADPHADIAPTSRDAFTDEGLNTSQVINRVHTGRWTVDECDNLIKTPLYSLWLFPGYSLFGTSTLAGRLWVLCGCLGLLWFIARRDASLPAVAALFTVTALGQYHLFQYIRFTMAEMTACLLVWAALAYALRYGKAGSLWDLAWSGLFLWAAVFVKNQFAYVLPLLPVWVAVAALCAGRPFTRGAAKGLLFSLAVLGAGGLVYYLAWYLPVKPTYDYVMADQAGGRFIPFSLFSVQVKLQAKEFLSSPYVRVYALFLGLSLPVFVANMVRSADRTYRLLSWSVLVWALAELHKFAMWYVPSRYLVPLLFSWGLFAAVQWVWALRNALGYGPGSRAVFLLFSLAAVAVAAQNGVHFVKLYRERTFAIHDTNVMLSATDFEGRPAAGPWAPALARETGARVIPVWYGYFNDEDLIRRHNPKIIITEKDEGDSGGAFTRHGLDLASVADSVREVKVARFDLLIYYLP